MSASRRALIVGVTALAMVALLTGCAPGDGPATAAVDPPAAADEIVGAVAAGREAVGGEWLGGWDPNLGSCPEGEQFAGYFEQQPARDRTASERGVRSALAPYGDDVVRTDRPDGSVELLLARDDGFLVLVTITDAKTSFIATSTCFEDDLDIDTAEVLPQTEPGVAPL
ncbi:hypothetical protein SOM11_01890 [Frigoribacterium sp. CFBP9039]|uniref:hypothetical protein n=1 Tax=Frigoribacterium sp. CFBP9029 TaxID=3096541 RepID=UPI002A6A862E|nr:hypothetical protein [Frigoribacterium sp. CFBP9039]MDY0944732.1 hypothetical protein [Frigoribacterium sp. CFBP9039]